MALRARELYYFVRVGNYASRPLRQLAGDMHALGAAGDNAAKRLAALDRQQSKLMVQKTRAISRQMSMMPGGADFTKMQTSQATRVTRNLENQRKQLAAIARAEERIITLSRARYDMDTRILRINQAQALIDQRITKIRKSPLTQREQKPLLEKLGGQTIVNQRRLISAGAGIQENIGAVAATNAQLENQKRLLEQSKLAATGFGTTFAAEERAMAAGAAAATTDIHMLNAALEENAAAQRAVIAEQKRHKWEQLSLGARALSDIGRTAQYAGGLTILALALMGRAAAKFQTEVTLAATQVGNNFEQVQTATGRLMDAILNQMKRFPASAEDMSKASYDIFSSLQLSGNQAQQTAQGVKVLDVANRAAVAGQANLVDVTKAGVTILNDFGRANKNATVNVGLLEKFMNRAFAAVRFGRMTFTEFTQALTTTAPAAKAANQTFDNMSGSLAFLTTRIPSVRTAGIAYARLLEIIQRAGAGLKERGIDIKNTAGLMRPLDQIMADITKKFPAVKAGRKNALEFFKQVTAGTGTSGTQGTIQARRAFVFLATQQKAYQRILRLTTHDQGEFWKSFRALRASPEVKWKIFTNQLRAMAMEIGQDAIPALLKMVAPIQRAVKWFESLSKEQRKSITTVVAWAGGIALVAGTAALLIGTVGRIVAQLAIFADKTSGVSRSLVGLETEAGAVGVVLARRLAIGAAIILMIRYHHQVGMVIDKLGGLKAILGLIATILTVRMVQAFALSASSAVAASATIVGAEAAIGSSALIALGQVNLLAAALFALAAIHNIKVGIDIRSGHGSTRDKITKALSLLPGYGNIGIPGTKYQLPGLAAGIGKLYGGALNRPKPPKQYQNFISKGYVTIFDGIAYMWTGKKWVVYDPKKIAAAQAAAKAANKTAAVKAQVIHNKTVQDYIALAIKANRYAQAHPHNLQAQIHAATVMDQIQKRFKGAELQGIEAVISADNQMTKKRVSNAKKVATAAKQAADTAVSNMRQIYDQLQQQNQSAFGDVTQGTRVQNAMQWGAVPRPGDILGDMRQMLSRFKKWRRELESLSKRGIPFPLLQQLEAAGPEAEPLLRGIMNLNKKQFTQYTSMFKQGQRLVKTATMFDFNRQLQDWRSHGRKAAIQFMKGMRDEGSFINRQLRKLFTSWMKGGNARLGNRPPRPHHPPHAVTRPRHTTHHHTRHLTIHEGHINIQDHGEDLSTKQRKARLMQKNRRANRLNWGNA